MAVIGTDEDQKDPNGAAGTPAGGGAAIPNVGGAGGGGYVGSGTGQGATTTSGATAAPTSSGFTNLGNYLSANQGGADQMAGAVKGQVDATGHAADAAAHDYQDEATADIKGGTVNVDQKALDTIKNGYDPGTGIYSGPDAVATQVYGGPQDASSLTGKAATDRASFQDLTNTLVGTNGKGGLLANANGGMSGVGAIEKGMFQQPSYTAGENNLDAFLTGGSGAYQQGLKDMNSRWGGEAANGTSTDQAINAAATAGKNTSAATAGTYSQAIADQQAKAKAWTPSVDSSQIPTMGTTSDFATRGPGQTAVGTPDPNAAGLNNIQSGGGGNNSSSMPFDSVFSGAYQADKANLAKNTANNATTTANNAAQHATDSVGLPSGMAPPPAPGAPPPPPTPPGPSFQTLQNTLTQGANVSSPGNVNNKINAAAGHAKKPKWA